MSKPPTPRRGSFNYFYYHQIVVNMKAIKLVFLVMLLFPLWGSGGFVFAQNNKTEGVVSYERKVYWLQIYKRMDFLSQEEKDREQLTWSKFEEDNKNPPQKMSLFFNSKQSLYTIDKEDATTDNGWGGTNRLEELFFLRDFEKETKTDIQQILGKTYLLEDSLHAPQWRVLNQIKDINGYVCMKAVTEDTIKKQKIVAWFSQDIVLGAGPEKYFGLPGLIMELDVNDGDMIIEAKKIEFRNVDKELVMPKLKGKKIKDKDYTVMLKKHIDTHIKAKEYPYSGVRY